MTFQWNKCSVQFPVGTRQVQVRKTSSDSFATYASKIEGTKIEGQLSKCYQDFFIILQKFADNLGVPVKYSFVTEIDSMKNFFMNKLSYIPWDDVKVYGGGRVIRAVYTLYPTASTL